MKSSYINSSQRITYLCTRDIRLLISFPFIRNYTTYCSLLSKPMCSEVLIFFKVYFLQIKDIVIVIIVHLPTRCLLYINKIYRHPISYAYSTTNSIFSITKRLNNYIFPLVICIIFKILNNKVLYF